MHLLANGTETASATLTADSGWTYTFTDVDKTDSSGNTITYTLTEDAIDGYESAITGDASSGFTVTNTKKIDITVTKNWVRQEGDIEAGTQATVHLLANGTEVDSATLTEAAGWTYTFTDLDQVDSSGTITYTLTEDAVDGYVTEISGDATEGFIVANIVSVDVHVVKMWAQGLEDSVVIRLNQDGEPTDNLLTLASSDTASEHWQGDFTDLPKYDADGNQIDYTVTEIAAYQNGSDFNWLPLYKANIFPTTEYSYAFIVQNSYRSGG